MPTAITGPAMTDGDQGYVHCLVDGQCVSQVPIQDRGLQYGDGLFETCAVVGGRVPLWSRHMQRLRTGCLRLGLQVPRPELLATEREAVRNGARNGVLKLMLTRREGGRGYRPSVSNKASREDGWGGRSATRRMLCLYPSSGISSTYGIDGIRLRLCRTRLARQPLLAGLKHLNRLEQVLARAEWNQTRVPDDIVEGVMLDTDGWVVEGTMTNLFMVKDGRLATPDLSQCGVAGVMRGWVMDWAADLGLECHEVQCPLDLLRGADEVFVCNSVVGIWPVVEFESSVYPIGALTSRLGEAVRALFGQ